MGVRKGRDPEVSLAMLPSAEWAHEDSRGLLMGYPPPRAGLDAAGQEEIELSRTFL